ncbi:MAG: PolC-type DNA polymerase III, partial [Clostridia bacterium]|nr:PolC-type DNA polymerase III [Clostridia bacterium]
ITYLFPTAHAAAYIISALRLGWFKVHRPLEFYCAYFSAAPDGFDAEFAFLPLSEIKERIRALAAIGVKATAKEQDTMNAMQILLEMRLRGIEPLPVDLRHSDAKKFLPEDGKMRLPLISLNGVGESAAESIAEAMASGEIFSQLDLIARAKVSKTVLAKLAETGALGSMPETNQLSFF